MSFLKTQWDKYSARKTKVGIVLDFLFLALFIVMINPKPRLIIKSFVIKHTLMSPSLNKDIKTLNSKDYNWVYKNDKGDLLSFSNNKGKVVVLNFWADWCPTCIAELSSFQQLYNNYKDKVTFIFINNEDLTATESFMHKKHYTLPIYSAAQNAPGIFKHEKIPTTYLISKKGEIILHKTGAAKWNSDKIKKVIDNLLIE